MSADTTTGELSESIGCKVTEEQQRQIRMAAARENMNLSEWMREVLVQASEDGE